MKIVKPFTIHALELGQMQNFIYLIQEHSSKQVAVVDPAWEIPKVVALVEHQGYKISDVLLTHSHHDHTNGLTELLKTCDAQVHLLEAEAQFWDRGKSFCEQNFCLDHQLDKPKLHQDGDTIQLGKIQIDVLHTPGHTPGSACYCLYEHLITGDTLFVSGCGRCDLNGGDPEQMYYSLKRLAALPPRTVIHPGHNYGNKPSSTIAEELKSNPYMQFDNVTDFVRQRM
ncbi:MBL fold metallo-hydrolase [Candidatus Marithioploca araucensis]|uniref:MBL fold metallo-hydrolase n=1 Tax=Candidatus Marithioploca araucensis TaxID=70273 RepID=A0ABT7VR90_9GAMM|nr:MBL fold metallo-hydrolase [Candidatus Marithioploca araucensis]